MLLGTHLHAPARTHLHKMLLGTRRGEPIPRLEYNADERRVWSTVLQEVVQLYPEHACAEYLRCFPLFNFRPEEVRR